MKTWKQTILLIVTLFVSVAFAHPTGEGLQVYQKNLPVSPVHQQLLADDIDRYRNADDLWEVLRHDFSLNHYENNPLVQAQIYWFLAHQDFLRTSAIRAAPYLYYILQQSRKRHLPAEVVLLPMIESAFNPFAYSSAGAAGIWQMMPGTANGYGLKQNWWYDGRRDVITSTKAALNHIAYLLNFFKGNWLLVFAAYDTGEGNVMAAITRNARKGRGTNFWSLHLAQETRDYVPRLLALAAIIANPDRYPVVLPPVNNAPYLAQIDVGTQMDLKHAATLAGLSLKTMLQLNPGYNRSTTDPHGPFKIVLPIEHVAQFTKNLWHSKTPPYVDHRHSLLAKTLLAAERNGFLASKEFKMAKQQVTHPSAKKFAAKKSAGKYELQPGDTIYMTREGDDISQVANRFHTSTNNVLLANNMTQVKTLKIGEKLIIPTHLKSSSKEVKPKTNIAPGDTLYMVRKGDTMEKIAKRFHTTVPILRLANLSAESKLHEGDSLLIPTHGTIVF